MVQDIRTTRGGDLQTAIHIYHNTHKDLYFTLIGVCHIAEKSFWVDVLRKIRAVRAGFENSEVHYEFVANDTGLKNNRIEDHPYQLLAGFLSLQMQANGLVLGEDWINTDMSITDILERAQDPNVAWNWLQHKGGIWEMLERMGNREKRIMARITRFIMRRGVPLSVHVPLHRIGWLSTLIKDGRSDYAMEIMLSRNTHIVTIWGAAHLKRMRRTLSRNGYRRVHTEYLTTVAKERRALSEDLTSI